MSKAFTKETDAPKAPPPRPRAPLPIDAPNYVTPRGLRLLREELAALEAERAATPDEHPSSTLGARITAVAARIGSAVVLDPATDSAEIRFGATVTVRDSAGHERRVRIVGVDEANAALGDIAFVSPFARALLGRRVGEVTSVQTPKGEEDLTILSVGADPDG